VAYRGKLVTVQEALGESPNGSGFVITLGAAPGLDATNLVVGHVVGGMDLVRGRYCPMVPLLAPCKPWTLGLVVVNVHRQHTAGASIRTAEASN